MEDFIAEDDDALGDRNSTTPLLRHESNESYIDDSASLLTETKKLSTSDNGNCAHLDLARKDIGEAAESMHARKDVTNITLQSEKQRVLRQLQTTIGQRQVTSGDLEHAPQWLIDVAVHIEMETNWKDAYIKNPAYNITNNANIISSHFVFRIKEDETNNLKLKARLVLHGNRDKNRFTVRRDSASADLNTVRMIISLAQTLHFDMATADVQGAYMQSGPIKRNIFVRPPKQLPTTRCIWKLTRLPYGIVEQEDNGYVRWNI